MKDLSMYSPLLNNRGELTATGKRELRGMVWNAVVDRVGWLAAKSLLGGPECSKVVATVPRAIPVTLRQPRQHKLQRVKACELPELGARLFRARKTVGISQVALAKKLKLSRETLLHIESNRFKVLEVKQLGRITEWLESRNAQ